MNIRAILFFLMLVSFTACQKELNFETLSGDAKGTLKKGGLGECLPASLSGVYIADSTLGLLSFLDVQVDLTVPGTYVISTDTVNGYFFRGTGTLSTVGLNTVRLYGEGTPTSPGSNIFTVKFDTTVCEVDIDVLPGGVDAVYSFDGAGGTCTGTTFSGTYTQGIPTNSSNTATVNIDVTTPGNYLIITTTVNGITFSGNGVFTTTGPQTMVLTVTGTPTAAGIFTFPVIGNSSSCAFELTFL